MRFSDAELLRRMRGVNSGLGLFVLELLHHSDDGELPAEGMHVLGTRVSDLGADMLASAEQLKPGVTRWWRSNHDLRVHAWPVPLDVPYVRSTLCECRVRRDDLTRSDDGEPCFTCADLAGELFRIPRWARELPRAPRPPGPSHDFT